jgi:transcriptional regulator with XRE-family HTH domain
MKPPDYARRIKKLRGALRLTQHTLAERLSVRPQVVASWEQGRREPSAASYRRLADLAPPKDSWFFLKQIGITKQLVRAKWPGGEARAFKASTASSPPNRTRTRKVNSMPFLQIPLLREGRPATPRPITARDVESVVAIPAGVLADKPDAYIGLRHRGEAMAPILQDGFIVVVDRTIRDPASLSGRMAVVWSRDGLVLRWLENVGGDGQILLRPENSSFPAQLLDAAATDHILGKVVFWWGRPR